MSRVKVSDIKRIIDEYKGKKHKIFSVYAGFIREINTLLTQRYSDESSPATLSDRHLEAIRKILRSKRHTLEQYGKDSPADIAARALCCLVMSVQRRQFWIQNGLPLQKAIYCSVGLDRYLLTFRGPRFDQRVDNIPSLTFFDPNNSASVRDAVAGVARAMISRDPITFVRLTQDDSQQLQDELVLINKALGVPHCMISLRWVPGTRCLLPNQNMKALLDATMSSSKKQPDLHKVSIANVLSNRVVRTAAELEARIKPFVGLQNTQEPVMPNGLSEVTQDIILFFLKGNPVIIPVGTAEAIRHFFKQYSAEYQRFAQAAEWLNSNTVKHFITKLMSTEDFDATGFIAHFLILYHQLLQIAEEPYSYSAQSKRHKLLSTLLTLCNRYKTHIPNALSNPRVAVAMQDILYFFFSDRRIELENYKELISLLIKAKEDLLETTIQKKYPHTMELQRLHACLDFCKTVDAKITFYKHCYRFLENEQHQEILFMSAAEMLLRDIDTHFDDTQKPLCGVKTIVTLLTTLWKERNDTTTHFLHGSDYQALMGRGGWCRRNFPRLPGLIPALCEDAVLQRLIVRDKDQNYDQTAQKRQSSRDLIAPLMLKIMLKEPSEAHYKKFMRIFTLPTKKVKERYFYTASGSKGSRIKFRYAHSSIASLDELKQMIAIVGKNQQLPMRGLVYLLAYEKSTTKEDQETYYNLCLQHISSELNQRDFVLYILGRKDTLTMINKLHAKIVKTLSPAARHQLAIDLTHISDVRLPFLREFKSYLTDEVDATPCDILAIMSISLLLCQKEPLLTKKAEEAHALLAYCEEHFVSLKKRTSEETKEAIRLIKALEKNLSKLTTTVPTEQSMITDLQDRALCLQSVLIQENLAPGQQDLPKEYVTQEHFSLYLKVLEAYSRRLSAFLINLENCQMKKVFDKHLTSAMRTLRHFQLTYKILLVLYARYSSAEPDLKKRINIDKRFLNLHETVYVPAQMSIMKLNSVQWHHPNSKAEASSSPTAPSVNSR